jgi:cytochrome c oxidase subunit IV
MHERILPVSLYVFVFVALVALTILTVAISFIPLTGGWHIAVGLVIALVKASLVALFFMHVISSPRLTWIVLLAAVFWLLLLVGLTFVDYASRGLVPGVPGH